MEIINQILNSLPDTIQIGPIQVPHLLLMWVALALGFVLLVSLVIGIVAARRRKREVCSPDHCNIADCRRWVECAKRLDKEEDEAMFEVSESRDAEEPHAEGWAEEQFTYQLHETEAMEPQQAVEVDENGFALHDEAPAMPAEWQVVTEEATLSDEPFPDVAEPSMEDEYVPKASAMDGFVEDEPATEAPVPAPIVEEVFHSALSFGDTMYRTEFADEALPPIEDELDDLLRDENRERRFFARYEKPIYILAREQDAWLRAQRAIANDAVSASTPGIADDSLDSFCKETEQVPVEQVTAIEADTNEPETKENRTQAELVEEVAQADEGADMALLPDLAMFDQEEQAETPDYVRVIREMLHREAVYDHSEEAQVVCPETEIGASYIAQPDAASSNSIDLIMSSLERQAIEKEEERKREEERTAYLRTIRELLLRDIAYDHSEPVAMAPHAQAAVMSAPIENADVACEGANSIDLILAALAHSAPYVVDADKDSVQPTAEELVQEPLCDECMAEEEAILEAMEDLPSLDEFEETEETLSAEEAEEDLEEMMDTLPSLTDSTALFMPKYNRSFRSRLIQSSEETKAYYHFLKNEFLSYQKMRNSTSWSGEAFIMGRKTQVRMAMRGKTLTLYYALEPADYKTTVFHHRDCSAVRKYANTPMQVRIKSTLGLRRALALIGALATINGYTKSKHFNMVDYRPQLAYLTDEQLLELGLIKLNAWNEVGANPFQAYADKVLRVLPIGTCAEPHEVLFVIEEDNGVYRFVLKVDERAILLQDGFTDTPSAIKGVVGFCDAVPTFRRTLLREEEGYQFRMAQGRSSYRSILFASEEDAVFTASLLDSINDDAMIEC